MSDAGRRGRNALVNLQLVIEELSGLREDGKYQARWRRSKQTSETPWAPLENGTVTWRSAFAMEHIVLPREQGGDPRNRKFLEFSFFKQGPDSDRPFGQVKVELFFENEKRKKASLAFAVKQGGDTVPVKLSISVQMKEVQDTQSVASDTTRGNEAYEEAPRVQAMARSMRSTSAPPQLDPGSATIESEAENDYAPPPQLASQLNSAPSVDNMKQNILKLHSIVQDHQNKLASKKNEVREIRGAYSNLRNDYEHLRHDLENSEERCRTLRDDLRREKEMNAKLLRLKENLERIERERGRENKTCDTACLIM
eukprot:TRINITY_DN42412_c0_g1_i1.p1 TRINITY_DN42412_c0_g1~~TRINITY_DN42412_c0_g1_i1.p1  ORF type:complete len:319 (+),score=52.52 TRINITY_DN42412_c0_g1_i1:26-958(+)